ncbi:PilW family protein [Salinispirillum marinum]|uniref:PilW family protein n=2 Tax=Saccharospirillaceae TaxID=255527 RepID=A0ABV8BGC9_9GAMM
MKVYARHHRFATRRAEAGMSLLEVLVALGIGLVLIAGVTQLFIGSNQAFLARDQLARMQENIRFISERLQRDIRMAGYQGCAPSVNDLLDSTDAAYTGQPYVFDGTPVMGWEYAGSAIGNALILDDLGASEAANWTNGVTPALPFTLPAGGILPGSDVLMVKRSARHDVAVTDVTNGGTPNIQMTAAEPAIAENMTVVLVDNNCRVADKFQRTNDNDEDSIERAAGAAPGNATPLANWSNALVGSVSSPATLPVSVYTLESELYYIRNNPDDIPSLYSVRLGPSGGATQELITGVENMQVLYGISTGAPDDVVNNYVPANAVTDFDDVLAVRVAFLMRSTELANTENTLVTYVLAGTNVTRMDVAVAGNEGDRFLRLSSTITVGLRNQLR